jgi:hypothetical protein
MLGLRPRLEREADETARRANARPVARDVREPKAASRRKTAKPTAARAKKRRRA